MFLTLSLFMVFTLINKCNKSYNVLQYEATIILQSKCVPQLFCNFLHQYVGLEQQQQQQRQDFIAAEHTQLKGSAEDECLFAGLARSAVVPLGARCHLQRAEEQKGDTADLDKDLAP